MSSRHTREKNKVNYNEKAKSAGSAPAWVKGILPETSSDSQLNEGGKENEGGTVTKKYTKPLHPKKASPVEAETKKAAGIPARGRNAGLTPVPIVDIKNKGGRSDKAQKPNPQTQENATTVQVVTKDVPGLPGIRQKRLEPAEGQDKAAVSELPSTKRSGKNQGLNGKARKRSAGRAAEKEKVPEEPHDTKRAKKSRESTAPAKEDSREEKRKIQSQGRGQDKHRESPGAEPSSNKSVHSGSAHMKPSAQRNADDNHAEAEIAQPESSRVVLQKVTQALEAAQRAEAGAARVPALPNCQRCQHFSDNFSALVKEYQELQRHYESLKSAKLSEEVEQLLLDHNRQVTEHGAKAAELATHWKLEAEKRQEEAEQYVELLKLFRDMEGELLAAQAEIVDSQAAHKIKDTRIQELEARLELLQRHVTIPTTLEAQVQTAGDAAVSAGVQAPSLPSPGVQMYEARGMIPEGAPGTIYKKPLRRRAGCGDDGASPPTMDKSYSIPHTAHGAGIAAGLGTEAEAAANAEGVGSLETWGGHNQLEACAAAAAPAAAAPGRFTSGSDMQLTAEAAQQDQERVAVSGKVAHGQGGQGGGRVAHRRASLPPAPVHGSFEPQQGQGPQGQRPGSAQLTAESLVQAAAAAVGDAAQMLPYEQMRGQLPQGRSRRLSAPPAVGANFTFNAGAPLERQLLFSSATKRPALQAVPEEEGGHVEGEAHTAELSVPPPPREGAIMMLGFEATPCKGGKYIFTDRPSGFVFELGPAPPSADTPGPDDEEEEGEGGSCGAELCYRCLNVGRIAHALPKFLHGTILIKERDRHKLLHIITEALGKAERA